jgi:hypothetical protein
MRAASKGHGEQANALVDSEVRMQSTYAEQWIPRERSSSQSDRGSFAVKAEQEQALHDEQEQALHDEHAQADRVGLRGSRP